MQTELNCKYKFLCCGHVFLCTELTAEFKLCVLAHQECALLQHFKVLFFLRRRYFL